MIDKLYKYKRVVELGNITKAAEELNITQPALTSLLKKLEKHFHGKLLHTSRTGVIATKLGKVLYENANQLLIEYKALEDKLHETNKNIKKNISVGMIDNVALNLSTTNFHNYIKLFPSINVKLIINDTKTLLEQIDRGEIDCAIITKPIESIQSRYKTSTFGLENLVLACNKNLSKDDNFKATIEQNPFFAYNKESNTHKYIWEKLSTFGVSPHITIYSTSPEVNLRLVGAGAGVSILPENLVDKYMKNSEIIKIYPPEPLQREIVIVQHKKMPRTKDLSYFLKLISMK